MEESSSNTRFSGLKRIYETQYKKLLIIPMGLVVLALILIFAKVAATGDFINRDVSLKGGVTITVPSQSNVDTEAMAQFLNSKFPSNDVSIKSLTQFGTASGFIVESDLSQEQANALIDAIGEFLGKELGSRDYALEIIGESLGASFFRELMVALLVAFVFMSIVVFILFRNIVPSIAVILAVVSDIIVTLAVVNLLGVKISTAGIAAFLMLIGYSVDTDILLTSRVLKRKEGTEMERVYSALNTGLKMTTTAVLAITAGLLITQSPIIKEILLILLIGLLADTIFTWIQNVALLRWYLEKKRGPQ